MRQLISTESYSKEKEEHQQLGIWRKQLIFVGGAKGVGKSSIIEHANKNFLYPIVHTGTIVANARQQSIDPNFLLYRTLARFHGIADSHYAGKEQQQYVRGLSSDYLFLLTGKRPDMQFVLIDSDVHSVIDRREEDNQHGRRQRTTNFDEVSLELQLNREIFNMYVRETGLTGHVISNTHGHFHTASVQLQKILSGNS